jgi:AraC family transcriptional regulator
LLERRIERAKSLLHETDLPITEIAHLIGCASHSHFSVMFHRATGQTPRDYRSNA